MVYLSLSVLMLMAVTAVKSGVKELDAGELQVSTKLPTVTQIRRRDESLRSANTRIYDRTSHVTNYQDNPV